MLISTKEEREQLESKLEVIRTLSYLVRDRSYLSGVEKTPPTEIEKLAVTKIEEIIKSL